MNKHELVELYRKRFGGLLSEAIHTRRIVAVGCGAGSYMIVKAARLAPAELRLVDPDIVDWPNLARTAYREADVGRPKVQALSELITEACPAVEVCQWACRLEDLTPEQEEQLYAGADLIIAGTDHFPTQARLNEESQRRGIPALFIGIHAGAKGGRIIWSVPGETACYRCVAVENYNAFAAGGTEATDLAGENGCLADIQCIDMLALKVAMALLERGQDSSVGRFYEGMRGRTEIIIRNWPDYEFGALLWDTALGDLPTEPRDYAQEIKDQILFAHDSVWLRTEANVECPDCRGDQKGGM